MICTQIWGKVKKLWPFDL